jgi:hypothetical protein
MFYKNNTFVFIRNYSGGFAEHEINGDFLTAVAVPWIYTLGSRASLLRKIMIDNGCVCPSRRATPDDLHRYQYLSKATRSFDIGPFISTLWRLDMDLTITVKQSAGGFYWFLSCIILEEDHNAYIPAVDALVQSIYRDEFNFRRYLRTIGGIHVFTDGTLVVVTFVSPRSFIPIRDNWRVLPKIKDVWSMANSTFVTVERGEQAQLEKHRPRELLTLPTPVTNKIMRYAQGDHDDEPKKVKLDDITGRLESLGPNSISHSWRHFYGQDILTSRRYKFEVTTTSKRGVLPGFWKLERLLQTKHNFSTDPTSPGADRFGDKISGQIRIIFDLDEVVTLRDVQYNLTNLLHTTITVSGEWEVVTVLHCPGDDGDDGEK